MFDFNDEDFERITKRYLNNEKMLYSLKYVVKCGLKYIYGKEHTNSENKIVPCKSSFLKNIEENSTHKCNLNFLDFTLFNLNLKNSLFSNWTNSNLAVFTGDNYLNAFFKNEKLFSTKINEVTCLNASNTKIYMGNSSGELIHFDPITQIFNLQKRHNSSINRIHVVNNTILTCSDDSSIFFRKKIDISNSPVLDCCYINDNKFVSICKDNSIVLSNFNENFSYIGHKNTVKNLSYKNVICTSSLDGCFGFLSNKLVLKNVNCSLHKQLNDKIIGFGFYDLCSYDYNKEINNVMLKLNSKILHCDISKNICAFSTEESLYFYDLKSNDNFNIKMDSFITDINFSDTGDLLYVATDDSSNIIDIRNIEK